MIPENFRVANTLTVSSGNLVIEAGQLLIGATAINTTSLSDSANAAYTNAITFAANADNISSGFVDVERLGSGTANTSTWLRGDGSWQEGPLGYTGSQGAPGPVAGSNTQFVYNNSGAATGANVYYVGANVGIGNTEPGSLLTVAGTIESTTGGVKFPDGTTQTTAATGGGGYDLVAFTSSGTWTKPAGLKGIKVTVVGAGGSNLVPTSPSIPTSPSSPSVWEARGGAGGGGAAIEYIPAASIPGPVSVTVGATSNTDGGTSSFGAFISATGGSTGVIGPAFGGAGGGAGGAGTGGVINISGDSGAMSLRFTVPVSSPTDSAIKIAGGGGASIYGGGGAPTTGSQSYPVSPPTPGGNPRQDGLAATTYGGGAGGWVNRTVTSNTVISGQPGIVIVEEFY